MGVLVLGVDYKPKYVERRTRRALELVNTGKATLLESAGTIHSSRTAFEIPSVIMLKVYHSVPKRGESRGHGPKWSKHLLFERDNYTCQYCGKPLSRDNKAANAATVDHITPRSEYADPGSASTWTNTCAACPDCNTRKSNKTMKQAGMTFHNPNFEPKFPRKGYIVMSSQMKPNWRKYIELDR